MHILTSVVDYRRRKYKITVPFSLEKKEKKKIVLEERICMADAKITQTTEPTTTCSSLQFCSMCLFGYSDLLFFLQESLPINLPLATNKWVISLKMSSKFSHVTQSKLELLSKFSRSLTYMAPSHLDRQRQFYLAEHLFIHACTLVFGP